MQASRKASRDPSFAASRGVPLPEVQVPGALPGFKYNLLKPKDIKIPVEVLMQFSIGDFLDDWPCSAYFDPTSPWYNVFYGAYVMLSQKVDGTPWGFRADGTPDVGEFLRIPQIDYTFLTAGMFACPPSKMRFEVEYDEPRPGRGGWFRVVVRRAIIPSGLHLVPQDVDYPLAYLMYGVPRPEFLEGGPTQYEPVEMRGDLFLKLLPCAEDKMPISLAWGTLCPARNGDTLRDEIIARMSQEYDPSLP